MDKIRIGVIGGRRGNAYVSLMLEDPQIELLATCDNGVYAKDSDDPSKDVPNFTDYDEMLKYGKENGMNAVFLANYFHQHTPFAIKAMEAGMDVVSECTSASTLKECVKLVEAVERTGRKYMLAENYPFATPNMKMEQIVSEGPLGKLQYAEGEYNHSGSTEDLMRLTPGKYHWRAWMPRTYYITHAMGPLMYMTKTMPKYVSARAVHSDLLYEIREKRHNYDGVGMMFCEMDNGMIARFTGCTAMASDYSRYRVVGDRASVETGGYTDDNVRMFWFPHTKPAFEESNVKIIKPSLADFGPRGAKAANAGHGGGDFWVVANMVDYFLGGKQPFFDVYKGVAMSATAILAWRSCLNHGENYKIPDFTNKADRDAIRNDDATPFPDENGNGATVPCALPFE